MNKIYKIIGLICCLQCLFFVSCSKDDLNSIYGVPEGSVTFKTNSLSTRSSNEGWQPADVPLNNGSSAGAVQTSSSSVTTRGIPITGTDSPVGSFGVLGYTLPGGTWSSSLTPSYMYNTQVTRQGKSGSYTYVYYPSKYWPDNTSDKVQFFAYYPYNGNGITLSSQTTGGYPTIAYSPSTKVTDQVDLMYASSSAINNKTVGGAVNLPFRHALTRVNFSVINGGTHIIKVQSIRLSGIRNKGTLSFDPSQSSNPWTLSALSTDTTSYKISTADGTLIPEGSQSFTSTAYQNVTAYNGYLLMLPQTLTAVNQVIVYYTIDGVSEMTILKLPSKDWTKAASVNYQIILGELSNSYIVSTSNSGFSFPIIRVNDYWGSSGNGNNSTYTIGSNDTWSAEIIWQESVGLVSLKTSTGTGPNTNIVLSTSSGSGNALIGIKKTSGSGTGTYLWSWHIWVTDYYPNLTNVSYNNLTWMDRNLGATGNTIISATDISALGLYYQWGRKDPFLRASAPGTVVNTPLETVYNGNGTKVTQGTSSVQMSLTTAIQNPFTFAIGDNTNSCWCSNPGYYLWDTTKTIYDPCPAGWKVPPHGSWTNTSYTTSSYGITYAGGFYPYVNLLFWYSGALTYGGSGMTWCWSSSSFNLYSAYDLYNGNDFLNDHRETAEGMAVRCVKE